MEWLHVTGHVLAALHLPIVRRKTKIPSYTGTGEYSRGTTQVNRLRSSLTESRSCNISTLPSITGGHGSDYAAGKGLHLSGSRGNFCQFPPDPGLNLRPGFPVGFR